MPTKKAEPAAAAAQPMTPAQRQAKVKAELEKSGGRKLPAINLPRDANENLQALLDAGHESITAAVIHSLRVAARNLR